MKKDKVFLGGTCANSTWREELIPLLEIDYFNPVVSDWTPDCIEVENLEKNEKCNVHLYVLTPEMIGVYSVAEVVNSAWKCHCEGGNISKVRCYILGTPEEWGIKQYKSLEATVGLINSISDSPNISGEFIKTVKDIII